MAKTGGLEVDSVPALTDIVEGRARMTSLRSIELEDLLGREAVDLQCGAIRSMIADKRVIITGAGGSIGRELVVQILDYGPSELICVDHTEIAIFNLRQEILQPSIVPRFGGLMCWMLATPMQCASFWRTLNQKYSSMLRLINMSI